MSIDIVKSCLSFKIGNNCPHFKVKYIKTVHRKVNHEVPGSSGGSRPPSGRQGDGFPVRAQGGKAHVSQNPKIL